MNCLLLGLHSGGQATPFGPWYSPVHTVQSTDSFEKKESALTSDIKELATRLSQNQDHLGSLEDGSLMPPSFSNNPTSPLKQGLKKVVAKAATKVFGRKAKAEMEKERDIQFWKERQKELKRRQADLKQNLASFREERRLKEQQISQRQEEDYLDDDH